MPADSLSPRGRRLPRFSARLLRVELLAGLVVALALIPEALSFSVIAGVDPQVALYASFTMAVTIAIAGGRPAMISAATGAMALVIVSLVRDHGVEYLLAAGVLAGVIQLTLGFVGAASLMRFVPRSVMTGFVNALAILIVVAQFDNLDGGNPRVVALAVAALAVIVVLARVLKAVPAPLVVIALATIATVALGIHVPTVGDEGALPRSLPPFHLPDVPFAWETLRIIAPYSFTLAVVGLLESLLTARLVDDVTDTTSSRERETRGQGIANVVTGFFGGMPGCALVGQTMMNVRVSGARTRLSTFAAGVFLLTLVVAFGDVVARIPMAALVAVMVYVSILTFEWHSILPATLRRMPKGETAIMLVTVVATVATHNLAIGVGLGVLAAMVVFARRTSRVVDVARTVAADGASVTYAVTGELFFVSEQALEAAFAFASDPPRVVVDLTAARLWDASAVAALDSIEQRYARRGTTLEVVGLDASGDRLRTRLAAT